MFTNLKTILITLLLVCSFALGAQIPKWEVGSFLGTSQYQGDINNDGLKELHVGWGAVARRHLTNNFALRGNLLAGYMTGRDANIERLKSRGFSFSSRVAEFSVVGEYDLLGHKRYNEGTFSKKISPYAFGGVGAMFTIEAKTFYNDAEPRNRNNLTTADQGQAKKNAFIAMPLGAGLKIDISEKWGLNLEVGKRFTFSDYVDKISQSANPDKKDTYLFAGAIVSYRFGFTNAEPKMPKSAEAAKPAPKTEAAITKEAAAAREKAALEAKEKALAEAQNRAIREKAQADAREKAKVEAEVAAKVEEEAKAKAETEKLTMDSDGDGLVDAKDKCPTEAGKAANNGCPDAADVVKKQEITEGPVELKQVLQFETGSVKIKESSYVLLDKVAETLVKNPSMKAYITGHTDKTGNETVNQKLSTSRANMCMIYLSEKGVATSRLKTEGLGSSKPITTNATKEGRDKNRRVEVEVK